MEEKIDFRHHYVLVVDTETANTLVDENGNLDMSNVLMYDCGWAVVDTMGGVYVERSYVPRYFLRGTGVNAIRLLCKENPPVCRRNPSRQADYVQHL